MTNKKAMQANVEQGTPEIYNPYCRIYEHQNHQDFDVYISGQITSPDAYTDLLNLLFDVDEDCTVHIKINSPGGDLDTGLQIQDAIENCRATVIGYLSGSADSAASAIFCSCDDHVVGDLALMLVHTCSIGFMAPAHDFFDYAKVVSEQNRKWLTKTYKDFITPEEIEDIIVNKRQLLLKSEEIVARLATMTAARDAVDEEEETMPSIDLVGLLEDLSFFKKWIAAQKQLAEVKPVE